MSNSHVSSLVEKHVRIEERLDAEQRRPSPDSTLLAVLKKQKLRLKEAIAGK